MSRVPSMSGKRKLPNPNSIGVAKKKIIAVPCTVNSWLYRSGLTTPASGPISWVRITRAFSPASVKKTAAVAM